MFRRGTLAEAVGQPLQDPIASSVGLPPLDTVSFWSSVVLGEGLGIASSSGGGGGNGTQPRQGLLVNGVYWDNTGLKLHSGGGNAVWQGEFYPNASTNFTGKKDNEGFFGASLFMKMITLPRQARDKHGESTQTKGTTRFLFFFSLQGTRTRTATALRKRAVFLMS